MRRLKLPVILVSVYFIGTVGYYFLPWTVRHKVYKVSPWINRTLQRQGFRIVEGWDGLGVWGRDCRTSTNGLGSKHTYGGRPARETELPDQMKVLENNSYMVGYSETLKNPLWVAYRVFDVPSLDLGKRPGFRTDHRTDAKVSPNDYRGSGYDRGHMAPNFAIATRYGPEGQWETFFMSNIIPQTPLINRYTWRDLEQRVARRYGRYFDEVWVLTGPVFDDPAKRLSSGVAIPSGYYKILLDEDRNEVRVMAFLVESRGPPYIRIKSRLVSIDEIETRTGLDFFPDLPDAAQAELESRPAGRLWPWLIPALGYAL